MANISQDIYDKGRRIRKILHQQKLGLGDWELNELQDTWLGFLNDLQLLSGGVGPVGDGLLIEATGVANQISVRTGVLVVDDTILFSDQDIVIPGLTTPGGPRSDIVFAFVSRDEKDEVTWPDIVNPSTGTVQALRLAYDVSFAVSENHPASPPAVPSGAVCLELALLHRTANPIIAPGEIVDRRYLIAKTYHIMTPGSNGRVTAAGGLTVDVEAADGKVQDIDFSVGSSSGLVLTDNTTNYIYVNGTGPNRIVSTTYPLGWVAWEAAVVTSGGTVDSIEDLKIFRSQDQHGMRLEDVEAASGSTSAEVVAARGTQPTLDSRLDVIMNEDGTLKPDAPFGGSIEAHEISTLRPSEQATPDMTMGVEAGEASYGSEQILYAGGSSPTFVASSVNDRIDLLYIDSSGTLVITQGIEAVTPTPPSHSGKLVIAEVYLTPSTTSITDTEITDVRPFLNLGGGGSGLGDVYARLQLAMDGSVFERAIIDPLLDISDLGGSSNGTLLEPSDYELDNGEILETAFVFPPNGAPVSIQQVGVVILATQELSSTDLQVRVDRGFGYETVSTFTGTDGTHVFTGGAGNVLNLEVTNTSGGTLHIEGYGLAFLNVGGASGYFQAQSGIHQDGSGLLLFNTNVAAFRASAADFAFTWDAANDRLSWGAAVGLGDDLKIEVTDYTNSTVVQALALASSPLNGVTAGSYVYFDMDRVSANITPVVNLAGPPSMTHLDRFILGRRISDPNGGNDLFVLFNNHVLRDITTNPEVRGGVGYPPSLWTPEVLQYIPLTGHTTHGLAQNQNVAGTSTYTYTIAGFQGVYLSNSKIRGLWVTASSASDADYTDVKAHWPGGVLRFLTVCDIIVGGGDDRHQQGTYLVPIDEGQVSLDFQLQRIGGLGSGGSGYEILGAWQVG